MGRGLKQKLAPLAAVPVVVLLDQLAKWIVGSRLPYGRPVEVLGDFLRLTYVRNPGMAFSVGRGWPPALREALVLVLPLLVVAVLLGVYFTSRELRPLQRWLLAAIAGGGLGNAVDRVFRPDGVIDFIDVKFYGLLGMERWPTFNLADSTVTVAGLLLLITYLTSEVKSKP